MPLFKVTELAHRKIIVGKVQKFPTSHIFNALTEVLVNFVKSLRRIVLRRCTIKRPLSGRDLGHVTQFRNIGTLLITFERIELPATSLIYRDGGRNPPAYEL